MRNTKTYISLFTVLLGVVIVLGIVSILYVGNYEDNRLRAAFSVKTEMIARSLDASLVEALTGTETDLEIAPYNTLKDKMAQIKAADTAARFVYLMGYENNEMFFFVDSEPVSSEDYSAPGDIYNDATAEQIAVFFEGKPLIEGPYEDNWGSWVSATAALRDPQTGMIVGVLGIDVNSDEWRREVWSAQTIPLVILISLVIILIIFFINHARTTILIQKLKTYNELIKQFVSFASHQLRTPLSGIKWATETLLETKTLATEQVAMLQKIDSLNDTMLEVIKDFLDMSSIERDGKVFIEQTHADIGPLIQKAIVDNSEEARKKGITITAHKDVYASHTLYIDGQKTYSVLDNLLSNAIKYSPINSTVTVSAHKEGSRYIVRVRDAGIGIPKEDQPYIFNNFYRAHNTKEIQGTGIGLYLVKVIMEAHGGVVAFESTEGKGTEFRLEFPL